MFMDEGLLFCCFILISKLCCWRLSHRSILVVVVATVNDAGRKGATMVQASSKGRGGDIAFLLLREEVVVDAFVMRVDIDLRVRDR